MTCVSSPVPQKVGIDKRSPFSTLKVTFAVAKRESISCVEADKKKITFVPFLTKNSDTLCNDLAEVRDDARANFNPSEQSNEIYINGKESWDERKRRQCGQCTMSHGAPFDGLDDKGDGVCNCVFFSGTHSKTNGS